MPDSNPQAKKLEVVPRPDANEPGRPQTADVQIDGVRLPGVTAISSSGKSTDLEMFRSQVQYFENLLDYADAEKK